jgi:F0F1-type ATP synthase epsilon subunit
MPRRPFQCEIYTPSEHVCSSRVVHVQFPASDGQVGVLGGRSSMVAMLGVGTAILTDAKDDEKEFFIARGFARMHNESLEFLAEEAMPVARLNAEQAWEELEKAQALPDQTPEQQAAKEQRVRTARGKFDAAQRYRRRMGLISTPTYEE